MFQTNPNKPRTKSAPVPAQAAGIIAAVYTPLGGGGAKMQLTVLSPFPLFSFLLFFFLSFSLSLFLSFCLSLFLSFPHLCVGFLFLILYPLLLLLRRLLFVTLNYFVTHSLSHTTLSHTILQHKLCHNFVTHTLLHTPSFNTNFVTTLSRNLFHAQLAHTQLCHTHHLSEQTLSHTHTLSFTHNLLTHTHNFVTHTHTNCSHTTLSHTTLSHTIFQHKLCHNFVAHTHTLSLSLFHTQLAHTQHHTTSSHAHTACSHTTLSHTIFQHKLCHTLSFTHNIVAHNFVTPSLRGRRFAWQVALGDIHHHFARQAWHLAASTVALIALGWLWWRDWGPLGPWRHGTLRGSRGACVAGVALGNVKFRFAWQAWHLRHLAAWLLWCAWSPWHFLRGRRGTWWHPPSLCMAGMALHDINPRFAWQAWHLRHLAGSCGALGAGENAIGEQWNTTNPSETRLWIMAAMQPRNATMSHITKTY